MQYPLEFKAAIHSWPLLQLLLVLLLVVVSWDLVVGVSLPLSPILVSLGPTLLVDYRVF